MLRNATILEQLQHPSGLFSAAAKNVTTGYSKAWIRDNLYTALGIETYDVQKALTTYRALLDIFKKHEYKIDWAITQKPQHTYQYIHARYHPETLEEFWEPWGNKQNDAIGLFLFKIGDLLDKQIPVLRDEHDQRIIQKLIQYLASIEYWHDKDNGMWEEHEEVHTSSVGACVAGLKKIRTHFPVPLDLIQKGEIILQALLPHESASKPVDLALLSLIWPLNVVNKEQAQQILQNVETYLAREKGVIRYIGDKYYMHDEKEARWAMGFPWLAIIYKQIGNSEKYNSYLQKTTNVMNTKGELPELYYADTHQHNENSPLGWGQALALIATQ